MEEKFHEYYNNWKKYTQFIYEGHFDNEWYKKIINEIDPVTIIIESYKILLHHDDWIAYAIEEVMKKNYKVEIIKRERSTEYIPLKDYCNQVKFFVKNVFSKMK